MPTRGATNIQAKVLKSRGNDEIVFDDETKFRVSLKKRLCSLQVAEVATYFAEIQFTSHIFNGPGLIIGRELLFRQFSSVYSNTFLKFKSRISQPAAYFCVTIRTARQVDILDI